MIVYSRYQEHNARFTKSFVSVLLKLLVLVIGRCIETSWPGRGLTWTDRLGRHIGNYAYAYTHPERTISQDSLGENLACSIGTGSGQCTSNIVADVTQVGITAVNTGIWKGEGHPHPPILVFGGFRTDTTENNPSQWIFLEPDIFRTVEAPLFDVAYTDASFTDEYALRSKTTILPSGSSAVFSQAALINDKIYIYGGSDSYTSFISQGGKSDVYEIDPVYTLAMTNITDSINVDSTSSKTTNFHFSQPGQSVAIHDGVLIMRDYAVYSTVSTNSNTATVTNTTSQVCDPAESLACYILDSSLNLNMTFLHIHPTTKLVKFIDVKAYDSAGVTLPANGYYPIQLTAPPDPTQVSNIIMIAYTIDDTNSQAQLLALTLSLSNFETTSIDENLGLSLNVTNVETIAFSDGSTVSADDHFRAGYAWMSNANSFHMLVSPYSTSSDMVPTTSSTSNNRQGTFSGNSAVNISSTTNSSSASNYDAVPSLLIGGNLVDGKLVNWTFNDTNGTPPPLRTGLASVVTHSGNKLFLIGGANVKYSSNTFGGALQRDYCFNLDSMSWTSPLIAQQDHPNTDSREKIGQRGMHASVIERIPQMDGSFDERLLVFGGVQCYDDVSQSSMNPDEQKTWMLSNSYVPACTSSSSSSPITTSMNSTNIVYSDFWGISLDIDRVNATGHSPHWYELETATSDKPGPRIGHAMVVLGNAASFRILILIGGFGDSITNSSSESSVNTLSGSQSFLDDVWMLHLKDNNENLSWHLLTSYVEDDTLTRRRSGHRVLIIEENLGSTGKALLAIVGGSTNEKIYNNEINNYIWEEKFVYEPQIIEIDVNAASVKWLSSYKSLNSTTNHSRGVTDSGASLPAVSPIRDTNEDVSGIIIQGGAYAATTGILFASPDVKYFDFNVGSWSTKAATYERFPSSHDYYGLYSAPTIYGHHLEAVPSPLTNTTTIFGTTDSAVLWTVTHSITSNDSPTLDIGYVPGQTTKHEINFASIVHSINRGAFIMFGGFIPTSSSTSTNTLGSSVTFAATNSIRLNPLPTQKTVNDGDELVPIDFALMSEGATLIVNASSPVSFNVGAYKRGLSILPAHLHLSGIYSVGSSIICKTFQSGNRLFHFGDNVDVYIKDLTLGSCGFSSTTTPVTSMLGGTQVVDTEEGGLLQVMSSSINSKSCLHVKDTIFKDNQAMNGGALSLIHVDVILSNVTFFNNIADGSLSTQTSLVGFGGGLHMINSDISSSSGVLFLRNRALKGGGMSCRYGSVSVNEFSFIENTATLSSGGLHATEIVDTHISLSDFTRNAATYGGGGVGVFLASTVTISSSMFDTNVAYSATGGGISIVTHRGTNLSLDNSTIINNIGVTGGGISITDVDAARSNLTISNALFQNNSAENNGGALYYTGHGMLEIHNSNFTNNSARLSHDGGLLHSSDVSSFVGGGGLLVPQQASVYLYSTNFKKNKVGGGFGGGCLFTNPSVVEAYECMWEENEVIEGYGGGIVLAGGRMGLYAPSINNNSVTYGGGGLFVKTWLLEKDRFTVICNNNSSLSISEKAEALQRAMANVNFHDTSNANFINISDVTCQEWIGNIADYGSVIASPVKHIKANTAIINRQQGGGILEINTENGDILSPIGTGNDLANANPSSYVSASPVDVFGQLLSSGMDYILDFMESNMTTLLGQSETTQNGTGVFDTLAIGGATGDTYVLTLQTHNTPFNAASQLITADSIVVKIRYSMLGEYIDQISDNFEVSKTCSNGTFFLGTMEYSTVNSSGNIPQNCHNCPSNANCTNGFVIVPTSGYWKSHWRSANIVKCPNEDACSLMDSTVRSSILETGNSATSHDGLKSIVDSSRNWNTDIQCSYEYRGPLCGRCIEGYGIKGNGLNMTCMKCSSFAVNIVYYLLTLLIQCILVKLVATSALAKGKQKDGSGSTSFHIRPPRVPPLLKIVISYYQIASLTTIIPIKLNPAAETAQDATGQINDAAEHIVSLECLVGSTYDYDTASNIDDQSDSALSIGTILILYALLTPVIIFITVSFFWLLEYKPRQKKYSKSDSKQLSATFASLERDIEITENKSDTCMCQMNSTNTGVVEERKDAASKPAHSEINIGFNRYISRRMIVTAIVTIFFRWPSIITSAFSTLSCKKIDADAIAFDGAYNELAASSGYWLMDTTKECFKGQHLIVVLVLGIPFILLFGACIPSMSAYLLYRLYDRLDEPRITQYFGFLYSSFEKEKFYWESIVLARKLGIAFVIVFMRGMGAKAQLHFALLIMIVALTAHQTMQPYKLDLLDGMETVSLSCQVLIIYLSILNEDDYLGDHAKDIVDYLIVSIIVVACLYFINGFLKALNYDVMTLCDLNGDGEVDESDFELVFENNSFFRYLMKVLLHLNGVKLSNPKLKRKSKVIDSSNHFSVGDDNNKKDSNDVESLEKVKMAWIGNTSQAGILLTAASKATMKALGASD